jgi:hypothetical protein
VLYNGVLVGEYVGLPANLFLWAHVYGALDAGRRSAAAEFQIHKCSFKFEVNRV